MSQKLVRIALAGVAGYGETYVEPLLDGRSETAGARLIAAADVALNRSRRLDDLRQVGCTLYKSFESMLDDEKVDLLVISTPIHLHRKQSTSALDRGISVLCEKPLAGGLDDARRMLDAEERWPNRFLAIGYQWSFSQAVQSLKRDAIAGRFGRPARLRTSVTYPRVQDYFTRSSWAGAKLTPAGDSVYDSPVNNATAHFLHNMLYVLGSTVQSSADVVSVQAELYRANRIENYDTAALRCMTADGAEILFYTTHAAPNRNGPVCVFEFEKAVITYDAARQPKFIATFTDGSTES